MRKPRFAPQQRVIHLSTGKAGTVLLSFPNEEGHRYYVQHSGFTWSIPEHRLIPERTKKPAQQKQPLAESKMSSSPGVEPKTRACTPTPKDGGNDV